MATTPYRVAQTQSALLDSLLGGDQKTSKARLETKAQKGRLSEEFDRELIEAEKAAEKELKKKRKKKWWEKIAPVLSLFTGPIGAGVISGLTGMYGASKGESHARKQIRAAKVASKMDPRWKKNFLSKPMREQEETKRKAFDEMLDSINLSGMDILTTGITSGLQGYGMGKIAQGIGDAWKGASAVTPSTSVGTGVMSGGTDAVLGDIGGTIGDIAQSVAPPGIGPLGEFGGPNPAWSPDVIPDLAKQGIIGGQALNLPGVIPRLGKGKLEEFAKLLKKNMEKSGVSDLTEILGNNEALLQNLLYALQWGPQQEEG